jgi:prepilin-type N-terminal cleavage/methylation domain-containing protein
MKLKNDGFTLIELLVGMLIMVILISVAFQMLIMAYKTYQYNMAVTHNKMIIRNVVNQITDEIRYTDAVTNPAFVPGQTTTNSEIEYTNGSVRLDRATQTIIMNNTNRTELASGMTNDLNFTRDGILANAIIIRITVNDHSYRDSPETTIDTTVYLSNF